MTGEFKYTTIGEATNGVLYKERGSKFFTYAFPVNSEEAVKGHLDSVKKKHAGCGHYCYAYKMGIQNPRVRMNDDGEPSNTAGQPIFGQIQAFDLTDVLVIVAREFGGTKLGVGGLIQAYKTSAKLCLQGASKVLRTIDDEYEVRCAYNHLNRLMLLIKQMNIKVIEREMAASCKFVISVPRSESKDLESRLGNEPNLQFKKIG